MSNSAKQTPQPAAQPEADGPLAGLRVVDITDDHPGAVLTMFLADYGADVVKLVRPGGNPLESGPGFLVWNRGKRSRTANLWSDMAESGQGLAPAEIRDLILGADLVVDSPGPGGAGDPDGPDGAMRPERADLDPRAAMAENEDLIWLSITPYGPDGPLAGRPGYEGTVAAATGILTEQATGAGAPMWNALPLAGYGTALLGVMGALSALHRRAVTGRGQRVSTSMFQGALAARLPMLVEGDGVQTWDSAGNDPQGALPNYRLYEAADGKWIHIGALTPDFWNKLAISADLLELVTDSRFETAPLYWPDEETRAAAKQIIGRQIARKPRAAWLRILRDGDVPVVPVMVSHELMDHPQVIANGLQVSLRDGDGRRVEQAAPPVRLWDSPRPERLEAGSQAESPPAWRAASLKNGVSFAPKPAAGFKGPLSGVRVLDLSSFLAGPIGPAYLADLGADVIKVEPIGGEGCRMLMMLYLGGNTGKRDLALNMKAPESAEVLRRLISRSDIVVHNNRVGAAERLGIDYETVRKIRPDVIYLHSTAFGSEGPDATRPGFDPLAQSLTGISASQGGPGRPPVFPKTPICDISTAMLGAAGVLLALYHRDRTGRGQRVETSLLATGLWLKSDSFMRYDGWVPPHLVNRDNTGLDAAYRSYAASDRYIFIGARTRAQRQALALLIGVPELAATVGGAEADEALAERVGGIVGGRRAADWLEALDRAGVPAEIVAADHDEGIYGNPQAAHLDTVAFPEYPGFTDLRQPGLLIDFSESPGERRSGAPACGEHTLEILAELGFTGTEITALESAGAVATFNRDAEPG